MVVAVRATGVSFGAAALLATATAVGAAVLAGRSRSPIWFEWLSVVIFGAFAVLSFVGPSSLAPSLHREGRVITAATMTATATLSLLFVPLTTRYTGRLVPPPVARTRAFLRSNRVDTGAWALTALAITASFVVATALDDPLGVTIFNWVLPIGFSVACARFLTRRWAVLEDLEDGVATVATALDLPIRAGGGSVRTFRLLHGDRHGSPV